MKPGSEVTLGPQLPVGDEWTDEDGDFCWLRRTVYVTRMDAKRAAIKFQFPGMAPGELHVRAITCWFDADGEFTNGEERWVWPVRGEDAKRPGAFKAWEITPHEC